MAVPSNKVFVQGALTPVSADNLNSFVQSVATVAALRTFTGTDNQVIWLEGTTSNNDGGQSLYYYNSSSTAADDGAAVIAPSGSTTGRWLRTTPYISPLTGAWTERTVAANQVITADDASTAYVGTTSLTAELPLTTTLTNKYNLAFYADGGVMTLTPQGTDRINGMAAGQSMPLQQGSSVMLVTDANGNWWPFFTSSRVVLSGPITIYVATTGSDVTNNGLSVGSPFATIQHAWDTLSNGYDLNGHAATIQLADGTYAAGVTCTGLLLGQTGSVVINGNTATPANVVINTSSSGVSGTGGAQVQISGMTLIAGTQGFIMTASFGRIGAGVVFGACGVQIWAQEQAQIVISSNYSVTGGAGAHVEASQCSSILYNSGLTITVTGTPAFSTAFALSQLTSTIDAISVTFSGSATGTRYIAQLNGVIYTNGGGASYFPGNSGGTTGTGGQYA